MAFILQWNCNGFYRHKEELAISIRDFNPSIICLQETHFKATDNGFLKGYTVERLDDLTGHRAHGGVTIAVREALYTSRIRLNTPFQAVAVTVYAPQHITVCNVYLPESAPVTRSNLEALVQQLPRPFLLLGDFNAHDPLWGSTRSQSTRRGRILASFIEDFNLLLLNNGEKTRFNAFNGEYSSIDLCLCSSSFLANLICPCTEISVGVITSLF
jgi:endonuclease/exonuclease/phosphatase family metal-dependent hydrolase